MTTERKILIGVAAVVGVLVIIQLVTIFRPRKEVSTNEAVIKAKDETIKAIQGEREAYKIMANDKANTINMLQQKDSVLIVQLSKTQPIYKRIDEKINSIPAYINRIASNDDSIKRAFAEFR